MIRRIATLAGILATALVLAGCGIYSFSGAMTGNLKSVAIPTFQNQTAEFGLAEKLTDDLVNQFTVDNSLKIRDLRQADSALYGTIVSVKDLPSTYSADEQVQEYKVTITVKVRYEDLRKGKTVWEDTISEFGIYPFSGGGGAGRDEGIDKALQKLSEDILNKTVSGW